MSRQIVDIGIEGNDGTGDSIRESFRKTNENFKELYAIFGLGGQISITNLDDFPDSFEASKLLVTNPSGTGVIQTDIVSNSFLDPNTADSINVVFDGATGKIILTQAFGSLVDDESPTLGNHLNAANFAIGGVTVTDAAADALSAIPGNPTYTISDLVIDKNYADKNYLSSSVPVQLSTEPANANSYTLTINSYTNNNVEITNHGLTSQQNGKSWQYSVEGTPNASLTNNTTYYVRYVTVNELSLHPTKDDAINNTNKIVLNNSTIASTDSHSLSDTAYDSSLQGFWLSNEPLPRNSVVRRQGDKMAGTLILQDHPGGLAGQAQGDEQLQAATKYYVDNSARPSESILYVSLSGDDNQTVAPAGNEGTSATYSYRTINAAANLANELVTYSQESLGPYVQTLTHTNGTPSTVRSVSALNSPQQVDANNQLNANKQYLLAEIFGWLKFTYPDYADDAHFTIKEFDNDYGNLIDSIRFDLNKGSSANSITKRFAQKFYSTNRDREKIKQHLSQNVAVVNQLYTFIDESIFTNTGLQEKTVSNITQTDGVVPAVVTTTTNHGLSNGNIVKFTNVIGMTQINEQFAYIKTTGDATQFELYSDPALTILFDNSGYTAYASAGTISLRYQQYYEQDTSNNTVSTPPQLATLRDLVINIWTNGPDSGQDIFYGNTYNLSMVNNSSQLDQTGSANLDALPSKLVKGKTSGALAQIVEVENTITSTDFTVNLLLPIEFLEGEEVDFGYLTREKQVTIVVESGTYEEDFPIKLPINTSIIGDELRRTLVKPKPRTSQSEHTSVYFYRDDSIDGNTLTAGGAVLNDQSGNPKGKIGYHYLNDPTALKNIGAAVVNAGGFVTAANITLENKDYLIEETIHFLNTEHSSVTYDETIYRQNYSKLIDALVSDLETGNDKKSIEIQDLFVTETDPSTKIAIEAANDNIYLMLNLMFGTVSPEVQPVAPSGDIAGTYSNYLAGSATVTNIVDPNLSFGIAEDGTDTIVQNLIAKINFVFDGSYNAPKDNRNLDVFLLNDGSTIENITVQEHGGFVGVIDPDGQIITKSPVIANSSSISRSTNAKVFAGGIFIDGYAGNIPLSIIANSGTSSADTGSTPLSAFIIEVESAAGTGLRLRQPQVPSVFYVSGVRYQVNAFSNYDQGLGKAIFYIDAQSNSANGYNGSTPQDAYLQMGGSRSVIVDNFSQVNDLGYGIITANGAEANAVNTDATYTRAGFYADSGGSVKVQNSAIRFGSFGLVAEGSDPNVIPDDVTLLDTMVQPAKVNGTFTAASGTAVIEIYDLATPPKLGSILKIPTYPNASDSTNTNPETQNLEYKIRSVVDTGSTRAGTSGTVPVYSVTFTADENVTNNFFSTLQTDIVDNQIVELRDSTQFIFDNVADQNINTRPNTTLTFAESNDISYGLTNIDTSDNYGNALQSDELKLTFNDPFDYIELVPSIQYVTEAGSPSGTAGLTLGDTSLAIEPLTTSDEARIVGTVFVWAGRTHRITAYTNIPAVNPNYVRIDFTEDGADISGIGGTGLADSINTESPGILYAGLKAASGAEIIEKTSIVRASNTSFDNVGKGSFNASNFPNSILGDPIETSESLSFTNSPSATNAEVWQKGKGKVFWSSSDQYGTFRVGKNFNIDQATGATTITGGIGIADATSLGFQSGTTVSEFSTDNSLSGRDSNVVPTEKAIAEYIDRRLGFDENGLTAGISLIGPGVLSLSGQSGESSTAMKNNLDMGSFYIDNLTVPGSPTDDLAVNVGYLNTRLDAQDELSELDDTSISVNLAANDLLIYNGTNWVDGTLAGDISVSVTGNDITASISPGVIVNADVSGTANIDPNKLDLASFLATTSAKGIAQFDSTNFDVTNGEVSIKLNGISFDELPDIAQDTVYGRTASGTGDPSAIPVSTLLSNASVLLATDFASDISSTAGTTLLTKINASTYGTSQLTSSTQNNAVVKRTATGEIDATAYQIDGNQILDTSGSDTIVKTPGGGVLIQGEGASNPVLETTGGIKVGDIANVNNSTFQDASSYSTSTSKLAATWIYTNFLEAATEKGASGTGIGLGTGGGFAQSASDVIINVTNGVVRTEVNDSGLEVTGSLTTTAITTGNSSTAGTITGNWSLTTGSRFEATYADIAEYYEADHIYEVGTVLVFGGEKEVTGSTEYKSTRVAGVVSNTAAFTMNQDCEGNATCVALVGRVPVKVIGKVNKGDMLVSSAVPGYAIVDNDPKLGSVIGKAISEKLDDDKGTVEVLVGK